LSTSGKQNKRKRRDALTYQDLCIRLDAALWALDKYEKREWEYDAEEVKRLVRKTYNLRYRKSKHPDRPKNPRLPTL